MPRPVVQAVVDHLRLEAEIGGYEAAAERAEQVEDFPASVAALLGCRPENVAFAVNATDAFSRALSSVAFEPGDVVLTTRDDYISAASAGSSTCSTSSTPASRRASCRWTSARSAATS
jgi:selenocysteine lyase/cysteine desulfurase